MKKPFVIAPAMHGYAVIGPHGTFCIAFSGLGLTAEGNAQRIADMLNKEYALVCLCDTGFTCSACQK